MLKSCLSRYAFWAKKGSFAVLDQMLASTANFLVNILLARWLLPEEYGAFTVAFSVFLFLSAFHTAIITEPMLVFGPTMYVQNFNKYLGVLIYIHFAIVFVIAAGLGLAALLFRQQGSVILARALAGFALASPFYLLLGVVRRACYVHLQPWRAAGGSAVYLVLMAGGLFCLSHFTWISISSALAVLCFSGLVSSFTLLIILKPACKLRGNLLLLKKVLKDHWQYGKWVLGYSFLNSSYSTLYFIFISIFLNLKSVAIIKAVLNLVTPALQFFIALTSLLIPWSVKRFSKKGYESLTKDALLISAVFCTAAVIYWIVLVIFGSAITGLVYADKYSDYIWLIPFVGLTQIFVALGSGTHVVLKAAGRSDLVFLVPLISISISLLGSWLFLYYGGLMGAAISINLFVLLNTITVWFVWFLKGGRISHGQ